MQYFRVQRDVLRSSIVVKSLIGRREEGAFRIDGSFQGSFHSLFFFFNLSSFHSLSISQIEVLEVQKMPFMVCVSVSLPGKPP